MRHYCSSALPLMVLAASLGALLSGGCQYDDGTPTYDNTIPGVSYCRPVSGWDEAWLD